MDNMLTADEKMTLLTRAGMSAEDAQVAIMGVSPVIEEEEIGHDITPEPISPDLSVVVTLATPEFDVAATVKRIVGKAFADKDAALRMCSEEGTRYFDLLKLSKVEAAARGLNKTAHNKQTWDDAQRIVTALKSAVRDHYRVGSVKAKIAASKNALPQEVRDLSDDALERLLASEEFTALARKVEGGAK